MPDQHDETSQSKNGANGAGDGTPDNVTKADLANFAEAIKGEITKAVNAAAKQQVDRQLKSFRDAGLTPDLIAKMAKLSPPAEEREGEGDEEANQAQQLAPAAKSPKQPKKTDATTQEQQPAAVDIDALLKKQAADFEGKLKAASAKFEKDLAAEKTKREEAARALNEERVMASVRKTLAEKKVRPENVDDFIASMTARKALVIGDDGAVTIRAGEDEHHDIASGVDAFIAAHPGAKSFLLPPQASPLPKDGKTPRPAPPAGRSGPASVFDQLVAAAASDGIDMDAEIGA